MATAHRLDPGRNRPTYDNYRQCKALGASKVKEICLEVKKSLQEGTEAEKKDEEEEDATTEEMTDSDTDTSSSDTGSEGPVQ